jgi:hypothetical protein
MGLIPPLRDDAFEPQGASASHRDLLILWGRPCVLGEEAILGSCGITPRFDRTNASVEAQTNAFDGRWHRRGVEIP